MSFSDIVRIFPERNQRHRRPDGNNNSLAGNQFENIKSQLKRNRDFEIRMKSGFPNAGESPDFPA